MKDLIAFIASRLVDQPDEIAVTLQEDEDNLVIELRVAQGDLGKVVGTKDDIARHEGGGGGGLQIRRGLGVH